MNASGCAEGLQEEHNVCKSLCSAFPLHYETKPVLQPSCKWLCLESKGRSQRQGRDQSVPQPVLLHRCPQAPRLQVQPRKAGVIFFDGGTSTHLLCGHSRALPQHSRFVEDATEEHYRSQVLQAPRNNPTATTVLSPPQFEGQMHTSSY